MNDHAKHADTLKTRSGDLKNNIFSAKIELDNLRRNIEGIVICFKLIITTVNALHMRYIKF